jgi:glycosyltransferase involved in cell wall biosynthesis
MNTTEQITERLKHENYYGDGHLINSPRPLNGQAEPQCILARSFLEITPKFSVVVPVHNQENIIVRNLASILSNTAGTFEMIIICDACTDTSIDRIKRFVEAIPVGEDRTCKQDQQLCAIIVIEQVTPIFETSCDNIGFTLARGRFCLEIQADMQMIQYGYNEQLAKGIYNYPEVFAVSGRCCHDLTQHQAIGKFDFLIEQRSDIRLEHLNGIFINQTCNRGPLLLDRERLKSIGYLDEQNYWLGDDDHDLMVRAALRGYLCGFVAIEFLSPMADGSTKKARSAVDQTVYDARKTRSDGGRLLQMAKTLAPPRLCWRPFV